MFLNANLRRALLCSAAVCSLATPAMADPGVPAAPAAPLAPSEPAPQIVISNPGTPTTARDPVNVNGIGQMVVDQQNGFLGLCTGSLINPRTVLFAAHCVNTRAATAYGAGSGGVPISFGFQTDNLPALQRWFNATIGGQANPLRYQSNPALSLYNVNQVRYNNLSLEPESRGFLYGDVATATLDTPAGNVPTWALLFSPLTPTAGGAAGTGYNVGLSGYGSNGNAATGSVNGSDFRRRIADNVVGALTDLKTFETFIFGSSTSPTQNLYFLDFDDPRRGQAGVSPFDFNAFRDNARGTTEGITAAGDSGGPLILQNVQNLNLAIGVLSGGYTRFFNGQPANGYGTVSFYQPLYLYWDWIAANNPYRYVANVGGDRLWTDSANWVTTLDPNYFIIGPNGQIVNGIPSSPGEQKAGRTGQFGEICFQSGGNSDCLNTATGTRRTDRRPIGTGDGDALLSTGGVSIEAMAEGEITTAALPAATLANGLPGATNFVPNNQDPVRATGAMGRYFDVTLNAAGTTTLNTAVTVDRFRMSGANARLQIGSAGSLTSLIDVSQLTGTLSIDGQLTSRGDFLMLSGLLTGNGRLSAPFVTNVMGTIAPGGLGALGTLTIQGNLVLSSGSQFVVDVGATTTDRLNVIAGSGQTGSATLGGTLFLNPVARPTFGANYTVLSAAGGVSSTFSNSIADLSAILYGVLSYTPQAVNVRIAARPFTQVTDPSSESQTLFARLLDQNRGVSYGALSDLYNELDMASAAGIRSTLQSMAPRTEAVKRGQGIMMTEALANFTTSRMALLAAGNAGGTLTLASNPAALAFSAVLDRDALFGHAQTTDGTVRRILPNDVSAFLQAGYIDGGSRALFAGEGSDPVDGWFASGGVELHSGSASRIGLSLGYATTDGEPDALQSSQGEMVSGTVYAVHRLAGGAVLDAALSLGAHDYSSERMVLLGATPSTLSSEESLTSLGAELGISKVLNQGGFRMTPRASLRSSAIEFDGVEETGGAAALTVETGNYRSLQARIGVEFDAPYEAQGFTINPHIGGVIAQELLGGEPPFLIGFANGAGGSLPVSGADREKAWGEINAGLEFASDNMKLDLSVQSTIARDDLDFRTYRAAVSWRF